MTHQHPQRGWIASATFEKYNGIFQKVKRMRLRDKRNFFATMRDEAESDQNWFLPNHGLTVGLFSFFHVLTECPRRRNATGTQGTTASKSTKAAPVKADAVVAVAQPRKRKAADLSCDETAADSDSDSDFEPNT
jgi:hypothetical protein